VPPGLQAVEAHRISRYTAVIRPFPVGLVRRPNHRGAIFNDRIAPGQLRRRRRQQVNLLFLHILRIGKMCTQLSGFASPGRAAEGRTHIQPSATRWAEYGYDLRSPPEQQHALHGRNHGVRATSHGNRKAEFVETRRPRPVVLSGNRAKRLPGAAVLEQHATSVRAATRTTKRWKPLSSEQANSTEPAALTA